MSAVSDQVYALMLAIIVVAVAKYISAVFQARARAANDQQYRALAERAAAIASSLAAVEKILQQV